MKYKYPRTPHLPWSESLSSDDQKLLKVSHFHNQEIVITEKLDGENTTLYQDYLHARSIDSCNHLSREWIKQFHAQINYKIPENWRLCGENVFAKHSIFYKNLESYFYLFAIFDENNYCLSFEDTVLIAQTFEIPMPKIFYSGVFDEQTIRELKINTNECEGYVLRNKNGFKFEDFHENVAKWVRKNHVQQTQHWMQGPITPNQLNR